MKRITIIFILVLTGFLCKAQNAPAGYVTVDSLVFTPNAAVDSTLAGESIYTMMPANVTIKQSGVIRSAYADRIENAGEEMFHGYRIRIFFDNKQNSRGASETALKRFKMLHPGIGAYRTFTSPYFKVTVGDFRTRSEALAALGQIKQEFPAAFIVREKFKYPAISAESSYRVDTLHIFKPILK